MRSCRARLRSGLRDLHPGSFAFVMATGIVSTGEVIFGRQLTSGALLVVAAAGYVVLCAGYALGAARYPACIWADTGRPERAIGFFTFVAAPPSSRCACRWPGNRLQPGPWPAWAGWFGYYSRTVSSPRSLWWWHARQLRDSRCASGPLVAG